MCKTLEANCPSIIVSFKQNLRVINKMTNFYWHYENGKKVLARQTNGDGWAIRKSLHKAGLSGAVRLQTKKTVKLVDALDCINMIVDKEIRKEIKAVVSNYGKTLREENYLKILQRQKI